VLISDIAMVISVAMIFNYLSKGILTKYLH